MGITEADLVDELQGLTEQKANAQQLVQTIDGAMQEVRGLLAKLQAKKEAQAKADADAILEKRAGLIEGNGQAEVVEQNESTS